MNATAIICKQCGSTIPIVENLGKLVCRSCGTEYILDNEQGEKILKEYHFDNPFIGVTRNIDPDLLEIQERMEMYLDYDNAFETLKTNQEEFKYKYGYWTLRLRAFTNDFKKNFDRYKPFEEITYCVEQHSTLSEFTTNEEDCIAEYYKRNLPILEARVKQLAEENTCAEDELRKLKKEENKLNSEISRLSELIASPEIIKANTKNEHSQVYLWNTLCKVFTVVFPILGVISLITIILIPVGIILLFATAAAGVGIKVLSNTITVLEFEYETKVKGQISQVNQRKGNLLKLIKKIKDVCLKSFYEYKHTYNVYKSNNILVNKFFDFKTFDDNVKEINKEITETKQEKFDSEMNSILNQEYSYYSF